MKIIIVGCGKVGRTLAEQLCRENHDVTVIDHRAEALKYVSDNLDALCVVGNGAVFQTQIEAGVKEADLLIATTGSDELNMLCCLIAKKTGDCHTVARIRNPEYYQEIQYIRGGAESVSCHQPGAGGGGGDCQAAEIPFRHQD